MIYQKRNGSACPNEWWNIAINYVHCDDESRIVWNVWRIYIIHNNKRLTSVKLLRECAHSLTFQDHRRVFSRRYDARTHARGWPDLLPHFRLRMHKHVRAAAAVRATPLLLLLSRCDKPRETGFPRARSPVLHTHPRVYIRCVSACTTAVYVSDI